MLKFSTTMHRKSPGYEVKSNVAYNKLGAKKDDIKKALGEFRNKMERIAPANLKLKYNITSSELVITMKAKNAPEAQGFVHKMNDYIKLTGKILKLM